MSLIYCPIKNLTIAELGSVHSDFSIKSSIHGAAHTNRAIYYALCLCKVMGYHDIMPQVWAAALIHDIARETEGIEPGHGRASAVKAGKKGSRFAALFNKAGLSDDQVKQAWIAAATHDVPAVPSELCSAVLKDADVMDRVRLGEDPRTFRFYIERSRLLLRFAEKLVSGFDWNTMTEMRQVWLAAVGVFNPCLGLAEKLPDNSKSVAYPEANWHDLVMARRLQGGQSPQTWVKPVKYNPSMVICTYMTREAFDKFNSEGAWKNVWETGATWHRKFNDAPEDARAFSEKRLYGEKGNPLTHAVWLQTDSQDRAFRGMYGPVRLTWKYENIWDCITFTPEDSQENASVFQIGLLPEYLKGVTAQGETVRYFEIQIHKQLRRSDVAAISM